MFERIKTWWADDYHWLPRWCRNIWGFIRGRQHERVGLWTMYYDEATGFEHMDYTRMDRWELPPEALHISGGGWWSFIVVKDEGPWPQPDEIVAVDYYLYAKSAAIDQALSNKSSLTVQTKTVLIAAVAIVGCIVVYLFLRGMI